MTTRSLDRDPRTRYTIEPVADQEQSQPGLTDATLPTPDHGEETYVGSGRLAGLRALITGGDSGIGRAVALAYAREGADVAIAYLPEESEDGEDTLRWIERAGVRGLALPGDLRSEEHSRRIVAETVEAFGGLDVLVLSRSFW